MKAGSLSGTEQLTVGLMHGSKNNYSTAAWPVVGVNTRGKSACGECATTRSVGQQLDWRPSAVDPLWQPWPQGCGGGWQTGLSSKGLWLLKLSTGVESPGFDQ